VPGLGVFYHRFSTVGGRREILKKNFKKKEEEKMREFWFGPEDSSSWYIREMMDRDTIHMSVSDLPDIWNPSLEEEEESRKDEITRDKVDTNFVMFVLNPCFLRTLGDDPVYLVGDVKKFKEDVFDLIKKYSNLGDLVMSSLKFRKGVQSYLNRAVEQIYYANFDDGKAILRDILDLMGKDFDFGMIDQSDFSGYNISYIAYTKVLYLLGLYDPEELRGCSIYLKKVPKANLWDIKEFLEIEADSIASDFFRGFNIMKENVSNREWNDLYDQALKDLDLVNLLISRVSEIATKNAKGETWILRTHDFFFNLLRKKINSLAETLPIGLRREFIEFHLPEEVQVKLSPRVVYRPWEKK